MALALVYQLLAIIFGVVFGLPILRYDLPCYEFLVSEIKVLYRPNRGIQLSALRAEYCPLMSFPPANDGLRLFGRGSVKIVSSCRKLYT